MERDILSLAVASLLTIFSLGVVAQDCEPFLFLNCPEDNVDEQSFVDGFKVQVNGATNEICGPNLASSEWIWGDESPISSSYFPATHTYDRPGNYTLTVSVGGYSEQCNIRIPGSGKPVGVGPAYTDRGFQCDGLIVIGHPGEYVPTFANGNGLVLASLGNHSKLTISNGRNGNINYSCRGKIQFGDEITGIQPALGQEASGTIVPFEEMCETWNIVAPGSCKPGGAIKLNYRNLGIECSGFDATTRKWQQVISPNGNTILRCNFR